MLFSLLHRQAGQNSSRLSKTNCSKRTKVLLGPPSIRPEIEADFAVAARSQYVSRLASERSTLRHFPIETCRLLCLEALVFVRDDYVVRLAETITEHLIAYSTFATVV